MNRTPRINRYLRTEKGRTDSRSVWFRIYVNGSDVRFPSGAFISEKDWNKGKIKNADVSAFLMASEIKLMEGFNFAMKNGRKIDRIFCQNWLKGKIIQANDSFANFARKWIDDNRFRLKDSTVKQLLSEVNKIEGFRSGVMLSEMDSDFILQYEYYLTVTLKNNRNTIQRTMKKVKMFCMAAKRLNLLHTNPFEGLIFKGNVPDDIDSLTEAELADIEKLDFTSYRMAETRDIFVLQCYTGMAYADMATFSPDHIFTDGNGKKWIRKNRQKSDINALIPVFPKTEKILERLKFYDLGKIRMASVQSYNFNLKKIALKTGLKKLTSHMGRKTCGMILLNNGVPIEAVSRILGHTSIKTTQKHYAKARMELLTNAIKDFSKFD